MTEIYSSGSPITFDIQEVTITENSPVKVGGSFPPDQVHLTIRFKGVSYAPFVLRIKSRAEMDLIINALTAHRDRVWPNKEGQA